MKLFQEMVCGECGIEFGVPEHFYRERRETKKEWQCPNGHTRVFRESDSEVLRRERDQLKQRQAMLEDEVRAERERAAKAEAATKRLKKRTAAGTCPCCKRTFSNMSQHMKHQHPDFVSDTGAKVVPMKVVRNH